MKFHYNYNFKIKLLKILLNIIFGILNVMMVLFKI